MPKLTLQRSVEWYRDVFVLYNRGVVFIRIQIVLKMRKRQTCDFCPAFGPRDALLIMILAFSVHREMALRLALDRWSRLSYRHA